MSLTIPQRVDKGIELLEVYLPNGQWALVLDPKILNMGTTRHCVLAQLAPHLKGDLGNVFSLYFEATAWIADDQDVVPIHDDSDWTADYGFQSAISEWRGDESDFDQLYPDLAEGNDTHVEEYEMLGKEWIKRINEIKEASGG